MVDVGADSCLAILLLICTLPLGTSAFLAQPRFDDQSSIYRVMGRNLQSSGIVTGIACMNVHAKTPSLLGCSQSGNDDDDLTLTQLISRFVDLEAYLRDTEAFCIS
jgi:hypothetical protein